jgi:hypothetical protein
MPAFSGNTATNATSTAYDVPSKIISFSLANKTGGAITVSIGVLYGSTFYFLYTHPLAAAGAADSEYIYLGAEILIPANRQIYIAATGSCDYYVTVALKTGS